MYKVLHRLLDWKGIIFVAVFFTLSACYPLTVNLNVATDKPISLYLVVDKPIEVKLDAKAAVAKLPPLEVQIDGKIGITKMPPLKVGL